MTPQQIASAIASQHETITQCKWSIEVNGLFRQNVYSTSIVLWTEYQDVEGNWWDLKNTYFFEEGQFNLEDYIAWRQKTINK